MKIEVYGSEGCKKCSKLKDNIENMVNELGLSKKVDVQKVEGPVELAKKGIMSTPAVAVDGEVKYKGKVPSDKEIKKLLR
jgi:small redox-active disulfide protein 2